MLEIHLDITKQESNNIDNKNIKNNNKKINRTQYKTKIYTSKSKQDNKVLHNIIKQQDKAGNH